MFAVPGWSVETSALKAQTEPQAQKKSEPKPNAQSNKRKRDNDNVTKRNVDQMYRRHIEGQNDTPKGKKQNANNNSMKPEKKRKKEQKQQNEDAQAEQNAEPEAKPNTQEEPAQGEGKKANKKQKKNKNKSQQPGSEEATTAAPSNESLPVAPPTTQATLTPLQQAMRQKLISSRFRHLNETLYTTPSAKALELFTANPELFDEYHAGFSRQVKESWPSNPVDGYAQAIRSRGKISSAPKKGGRPDKNKNSLALPRRPNGLCTIADLGCGDAQLASGLTPSAQKLNLKLLSYDLHAPNQLITKADISNLPVKEGSVDIAIFCLSLMGTNWVSFVEEAWRVLRGDGKGECWVSEVKSRFGKVNRKKAQIGAKKPLSKAEQKKQKKKRGGADDDAGSDADDADIYAEDARPAADNDETDISTFVEVFRTRGFTLKPESVDKSNKMFVRMVFVKHGTPTKGKHASVTGTGGSGPGKKKFIDKQPEGNNMTPEEEAAALKPCVYKIR
ncbi:hypothetical protein ASPWEDRAFT_117562 [Aspergillus wentii DTO 134E9]|uniref:Ribosomal RNA-processing protein 8 n=1 Tax=Aspergillus wentii DTO 134E9 TaxID=1073089 RepID=A0A1L9RBA4_ASPWE|nr:uncharacterized protein ASPWEDRAFT_117562 [Aspergillus wentii DTO 134E9]KAI9934773.1 25S rRNA (adenine645-N1)-methyltransferase [Aspergillus wentii]OJJ32201.1 hypothetical protein ASPWEDRAFT_117562 [Aspergillus wentii DTO 134E9]